MQPWASHSAVLSEKGDTRQRWGGGGGRDNHGRHKGESCEDQGESL